MSTSAAKHTATLLVTSDYTPPSDFGGVNTPIHHASTVTFPNVAAMRARDWRRDDAYSYGLQGTPTTYTLAQRIAEIEGGRHSLLVPSGLAAIMLVNLALLKTGDQLLLPDNVYNPSRELADGMLRDFGITTRYYDPLCGAAIANLITPATRLIWIEAPGSVTMEVPDVPAIAGVARAHGVLTAIDNTWAAGLLFRPFDHGIDIAMHALTKYPSGGSDVLMGSVTTRDAGLHERIKLAHVRLGLGVAGDDAYLLLRGLPTMAIRLAQHDHSAMQIAHWLAGRAEVGKVLHPAFPECPGHAFWKRDFTGAASLFSVIFDAAISEPKVDAMINALRLFKIGFSWGGAHSLAVPYRMASARTAVPWGASGILVRFYVGLEDPRDLLDDLQQAFGHLQ
jgi:cystathionine beta-lyase